MRVIVKQNPRCLMGRKSRWAAFVLAALVIWTTLSSLTSTTRTLAGPTPPPAVEKTDFDIFRLDANSGAVNNQTGGIPFGSAVPGYNLVRTFKNGIGQTFVFLLNSNTGKAIIYQANAVGGIGSLTWDSFNVLFTGFRCTSAEFVQTAGINYLLTHNSFTGQIHKFRMNDDGSPNFGSMTITTLNDWKDKNLFSHYYYNGACYLLGYDTWTGAAVVYSINGLKIAGTTWTRGWTSVDHLTFGGVTYRALYKAAGDPHKKPGESGDQLGRFIIQKIAANGVEGENILDGQVGPNYSAVRFALLSSSQGVLRYALFFYQRATGSYFTVAFDTQTGVTGYPTGGQIIDGGGQSQPYVDVEPYTVNGQTYLAFLNDDNAKPFNYDQAEKMARTIHDELADKTVGYQFMLAQSGRVIYSRAWGKSKLSHIPDQEVDMTTHTRLNLASVSKMITTMTVLKLADNGMINDIETDRISQHLDPDDYPANSWVTQRPLISLLTHTTGLDDEQGGECEKLDGDKMDCINFFSTTPQLNCGGPGENCERNYNNYNTNAARIVIQSKTGAETAEQIVAQTHELWADSVNLSDITCSSDNNINYFARCDGAPNCYSFNGQSWRQGKPDATALKSCSAGGWYATARDMVEFLAAIRYKKILSSQYLNNLLTSTTMSEFSGSPGSTALGWARPWDAEGVKNLGKNGSIDFSGVGVRTYITRLPNNCDAVLLVNSAVEPHPDGLLIDAYKYAVSGYEYLIRANGETDGYTISRVAVNTADIEGSERRHVAAVRDINGRLKLAAYLAASDTGEVALADEEFAYQPFFPFSAIAAQKLAITDGANFATASIDNQGTLSVIGWLFDGDKLTQHGLRSGLPALEVAVTKAAMIGPISRVVTATRNVAGNLELNVWLIDYSNNTIILKDTYEAGAASAVAIKTLRYATDYGQSARVVAASRNGSGKLQVDVFDVNGFGNLEHKGIGVFGPVSNSISIPTRIALDTLGDGKSGFFDGGGFMTAVINSDNELDIATWQVNWAGVVSLKGTAAAGDVSDLALAGTTTAVRLTDNNLKLIKWVIGDDGMIRRDGERTIYTPIAKVAATGNIVTALQLDDGKFRLINWKVISSI
ncbi:MAG TPA: serine hydrolase [Blastocatellia bacterium]|nr:serine hydrolase [Blastocatellia bacterium]